MADKLEKESNRKATIGTSITVGVLLVVMLLFGFTTPLPLPEEEGIAVNLGFSDDGMGDDQPLTPIGEDNTPEPAESEAVSEAQPEPVVADPTPIKTPDPVVTAEDLESIRLKKEEDKKKREEIKKIEDAKKAEDAIKAENARKAEQARKEKEAKDKAAKEIQDRIRNARNQSGGSSTGGQGNTGNPGDQGNPNGNPNSTNQGPGNASSGNGNSEHDLSGRTFRQRPIVVDNSQIQGRIVVTVQVDRDGNVTSAKAGAQGTTITDAALRTKCEQAALKAKFTPNPSAPEIQRGTITFRFSLQ